MKPELSIIVPCYNEEENIPLIVKRFHSVLPHNLKVELILVDNGSKDNSNEVIRRLTKKYSCLRLAEVKINEGYGNGVWKGIKKANGEFICWTHADMQTDIEDTIKAYHIIKNQNLPEKFFVKGRRKGRLFVDNFFTLCMSLFETIMLGEFLYDINAQPNLFHKSFLMNIKDPPKDFSFDLYFFYIAKKKLNIIRFPVDFSKRLHGKSDWNTGLKGRYKFIKRTVDFTIKLRKKI